MIYRAIGLMSGSSLDGLDIVFAEIHVSGRTWGFEILAADCYPYSVKWTEALRHARHLTAYDYWHLHQAYGHYLGEQVNAFMEAHQLQHQVQLVASHGHTVFHNPAQGVTAQLGDGASIAAETGLQVISDLRALDVALGGQGAPIVPIGEQLLLPGFDYYLNIGGIANISYTEDDRRIAFDVCPANRVLNMLAAETGKEYDFNGEMAATGTVQERIREKLNALPYYKLPPPKSLANEFGTETVFPILKEEGINTADALRTMVAHIADQLAAAITHPGRMLVTGGGALNSFLITEIRNRTREKGVELEVPDVQLVQYKEALIIALMGVLRWRQDENVLASVTGAARNSVGGALWCGA